MPEQVVVPPFKRLSQPGFAVFEDDLLHKWFSLAVTGKGLQHTSLVSLLHNGVRAAPDDLALGELLFGDDPREKLPKIGQEAAIRRMEFDGQGVAVEHFEAGDVNCLPFLKLLDAMHTI